MPCSVRIVRAPPEHCALDPFLAGLVLPALAGPVHLSRQANLTRGPALHRSGSRVPPQPPKRLVRDASTLSAEAGSGFWPVVPLPTEVGRARARHSAGRSLRLPEANLRAVVCARQPHHRGGCLPATAHSVRRSSTLGSMLPRLRTAVAPKCPPTRRCASSLSRVSARGSPVTGATLLSSPAKPLAVAALDLPKQGSEPRPRAPVGDPDPKILIAREHSRAPNRSSAPTRGSAARCERPVGTPRCASWAGLGSARRCIVRFRCDTPARSTAEWPTSRPCSADESVATLRRFQRWIALSFHGLCSPPRSSFTRSCCPWCFRGSRARAPKRSITHCGVGHPSCGCARPHPANRARSRAPPESVRAGSCDLSPSLSGARGPLVGAGRCR